MRYGTRKFMLQRSRLKNRWPQPQGSHIWLRDWIYIWKKLSLQSHKVKCHGQMTINLAKLNQ